MKPILSNETLRTAVEKELASDPEVDARHISVTAVDGAVSLGGYVVTYHQKHAAVRAAERVEAAMVVADEIEIGPESEHEHSDAAIAEEIAHLRAQDLDDAPDSVGVQVRDGRVFLHGQVSSASERDFVECRAHLLTDARAVVDLVKIKPPRKDANAEVEDRVREAIAHLPDLETSSIRVSLNNGAVHLRGRLSSADALEAVLHAAETTAGVAAVESDIVVTLDERASR